MNNEMNAEYVTHTGNDLLVANIARVSFNKESTEFTYIKDKKKGSDEGIIKYLAAHHHWTPFSHPSITLRIKAPVPIRTQMFKHKVGFTENEESRRYISSTPELFIPETFRSKPDENAKQGSSGDHPDSDKYLLMYKDYCSNLIDVYEEMVEDGVAPEQARLILPQGCMVNWIWTGSLAAYARMYKQRTDPHAQKEVQVLAKMIGGIIEPLFPVSWAELIK